MSLEFQIHFLRQLKELLAEGGFFPTHKFVQAISVEMPANDDGSMRLKVEQIAKKRSLNTTGTRRVHSTTKC